MMTTKGTASQSSKIATQFKGDTNYMGTPLQSNPVGSMVVATEGNELKTISAGSGNIIGIEGARASLMQVCAATGVPETYLTMDPSTGNLATAKEISPVFITMIEERQTGWKDALTDVFTFVLGSDEFEVSFAPIRDNIQQYVANVNAFAWSNGQWTGAMKGKDYIKAGYEALEWKLPQEEDLDEMGDALDNGADNSSPEDNPYSTDTDLGNVATAARDLTQAVKEAARLKEAEDDTEWITVGGQHIPIKPGQSKGDAVKNAFGGKGSGGDSNSPSTSASSGGSFAKTDAENDSTYSPQEKKSIEKYRSIGGSEYTAINNAARSGKTNQTIKDIDSAINKSPAIPKGTELYRGLSEKQSATLMNAKVGDSFTQGGYQSYSLDKSVADSFAGTTVTSGGKWSKTVLRIEGDGSTKGIHIGSKEAEVLLPRGQKYTITGRTIEKVKGTKIKMNIITVKVGDA
jgi:hypothetical protein